MNARSSAAIALIASTGLALSACFPPNENPSDVKVDTATEQKADTAGDSESGPGESGDTGETAPGTSEETVAPSTGDEVQVIDCFGEPESEPTELTADCTDPEGSQVTDITWQEWSEESATGTGTSAEGEEAEIELSEPTDTGNGLVFSTVTVDGQPVSN